MADAKLVLITLLLCFGIANAYNYNDLCNRDEKSTQFDMYVFGSSYTDWGNWIVYYDGSGYNLDQNNVIQPPTTWYNTTSSSVNIINTQGRASDGKNMIDFIGNYYNLTKSRSVDLLHLPTQSGNLVNFGIFGATANGNLYNKMYPLGTFYDFSQVAGNYGYDFQVSDFLIKLQNNPLKQISKNDVFIFDFVGGVDFPLIASCSDPTTCYSLFADSILQSMLELYNAGMRKMVFIHLDALFKYVPSFNKFDVSQSTNTGASIDLVISSYFNPMVFYKTLTDFRRTNMPLLNLQRVSYGDVFGNVLFRFALTGYRNNLYDDPDPRTQAYGSEIPPSMPFPTKYDYYSQYGVNIANTFFNDDNQPTEFSYRIMAKFVLQTMQGMITQCD